MNWRDAIERFAVEFGGPTRETVKVKAWHLRDGFSVVIQIDQPNREQAAYVWLPYPADGQPVPEFVQVLEYAGESGRHSNTYPSPGLERGKPALKLIVRTEHELDGVVATVGALRDTLPAPEIKPEPKPALSPTREELGEVIRVDLSKMPPVEPPKPRREAIPRAVQREVWQRDAGRCVECGTQEKLCFDHIVPHSRGGGNTVRNIQLMCEPCNLRKGNRL